MIMIACQSNAGLYLDKITDQGSGRNVGGGGTDQTHFGNVPL